jgi:hypothetical protein
MAHFFGGMDGGVKPPLQTPATTVRVKIETSIGLADRRRRRSLQKQIKNKHNSLRTPHAKAACGARGGPQEESKPKRKASPLKGVSYKNRGLRA